MMSEVVVEVVVVVVLAKREWPPKTTWLEERKADMMTKRVALSLT